MPFKIELEENQVSLILESLSELSKRVGIKNDTGFNTSALQIIVGVADNIIKQVNEQKEVEKV